jgi:hypothetical protein
MWPTRRSGRWPSESRGRWAMPHVGWSSCLGACDPGELPPLQAAASSVSPNPFLAWPVELRRAGLGPTAASPR